MIKLKFAAFQMINDLCVKRKVCSVKLEGRVTKMTIVKRLDKRFSFKVASIIL